MNIEESKSLLGWVSLNKLYIDTHNECDYHNIHTAIETLLTAYEKEKEKNKELNKLKGFEMLDIFNMGKQSSRQRIEFDYVDKEKIKAGIEEARKRYNDLHTKHLRDCGIAEQRELAKIEFGESLLKEE